MSLIFLVGTTILSVTASDYKIRINEGKKLENLYEADSGLNIVENIIIKTSQEAIKYADKEVKKEFSRLNKEDRAEDKINKLFKEKFYDFFLEEKEVKNSEETIKNVKILEYLISTKQIITSEENKVLVLENVDKNKNFSIEILEYKEDEIEKDMITIEVQSKFETKTGELKNKKTVSTTYTIKPPNYNAKISNVAIYPVFDNKALTIDGDLNINSGETSITGDIWIKGNDPSKNSEQYIFEKYDGGIYAKNSTLNIKGDVLSTNTLQLSNNSNVKVEGNIYAKNIYSGKNLKETVSNKNNLTVSKNVLVNNDLAMNSTESAIEIEGNFYGINDKTTEGFTVEKALTSSSIIVNDISKTSKITVNGDSYIMGVAYLNATSDGNKYQTGESVAVKGNYLAYTDVEINNGVTLKYYNPLQLLESIDKDGEKVDSLGMKAEYFEKYYNNSTNKKYLLEDGGVDLKGNIYSAGASIKSGKVQGAFYNEDSNTSVSKEKENFKIDVLAMGDGTGISGLEDLYLKQEAARTVSNQIDFNKVKTNQIIKGKEGTVILIGDGSELQIKNQILEIKNNTSEEKSISIDKGLIITNGNISIKEGFTFTGNIITTGTVNLEGKNNIAYDSKLIRSILAENEKVLSEIFETKSSNQKSEEIKISTSTDIYGVDTFLDKSSWKIVK